MPQGPIPVQVQGLGGIRSALNVTAASVVKSTPGTLFRAAVISAGTTGGAFTINDSNALVTAQTITAITAATSAVVTISTGGGSNPFAVGNTIAFASVVGMTQINAVVGTVTAIGGVTTAWTITTNINSSAFTAYSSAGTAASFSAANVIWTLPQASAAINLAGSVIALEFPCLNGILVSAMPTATGILSLAYT